MSEKSEPIPAELIEATRQKLEAETRKLDAEALQAEAEASVAVLKAKDLARGADEDEVSDDRRHIYRFNSDVSATSVTSLIKKTTEWSRLDPKAHIEVVFNSPGGSIIDGFALFDHLQDLRQAGHTLTTGATGMAASMAGVLLQAGDHRWVGQQSFIMIHRAAFAVSGQTHDIEDRVKFAVRLEKRILNIFTARSNLTVSKIKRNWDRTDWWIEAEQALDFGLVDEVRGQMPEYRA